MKETYTTPQLEVIALGTEQSILDVSSGTLSLLAITQPGNGLEEMSGWGVAPSESWTD